MKSTYREINAAPLDLARATPDNQQCFHTFNPNSTRTPGVFSPQDHRNMNIQMAQSPMVITMPNQMKLHNRVESKGTTSSNTSGVMGVAIPRLDMQKINEYKG